MIEEKIYVEAKWTDSVRKYGEGQTNGKENKYCNNTVDTKKYRDSKIKFHCGLGALRGVTQ